jgi:hypothetical protein
MSNIEKIPSSVDEDSSVGEDSSNKCVLCSTINTGTTSTVGEERLDSQIYSHIFHLVLNQEMDKRLAELKLLKEAAMAEKNRLREEAKEKNRLLKEAEDRELANKSKPFGEWHKTATINSLTRDYKSDVKREKESLNSEDYLVELKLEFDNAIIFCQSEDFSKGALSSVLDNILNNRITRLKKQRLTTNI